MSPAGRDALVAMLSRLKNDLKSLDLSKPEQAQAVLQQKYPLVGDYLVEVRRLCERGVEEGWLCSDERDGIRYSRLTPPTKWFPYSVDVVDLSAAGPGHRHPRGEINVGWPLEGKPKFCGNPPGWTVLAPGSQHVPEVRGGRMFLLYFLPGGAIEWLPRPKQATAKASPRKPSTVAAKTSAAKTAAARTAAPTSGGKKPAARKSTAAKKAATAGRKTGGRKTAAGSGKKGSGRKTAAKKKAVARRAATPKRSTKKATSSRKKAPSARGGTPAKASTSRAAKKPTARRSPASPKRAKPKTARARKKASSRRSAAAKASTSRASGRSVASSAAPAMGSPGAARTRSRA